MLNRYLLLESPDTNDYDASQEGQSGNPPKSLDLSRVILKYTGANINYVPAISKFIEINSEEFEMIIRMPTWADYTLLSDEDQNNNAAVIEALDKKASCQVVEKVKRYQTINKATVSILDSANLINQMQFSNWQYNVAPDLFMTIDLVQLVTTLGAPDFALNVLLNSDNIAISSAFPQTLKDDIIADLSTYLKKNGTLPL